MDVDRNGQVAVCGHFQAEITFGATTLAAEHHAIAVAKFDGVTGGLIWATAAAEGNLPRCRGLKFGALGDVMITGSTFIDSVDHTLRARPLMASYDGANGDSVWRREYADVPGSGFGRAIDVNEAGEMVVAGWHLGDLDACFSVGGPVIQPRGHDFFVAKYGLEPACKRLLTRIQDAFLTGCHAPSHFDPGADLNHDGIVDIQDFSILAPHYATDEAWCRDQIMRPVGPCEP